MGVSGRVLSCSRAVSRQRVRVLFSIDTEKTDLKQGRGAGQLERADDDYALAWIRSYGRGRTFYCTIAHNPYVFWDARMLRVLPWCDPVRAGRSGGAHHAERLAHARCEGSGAARMAAGCRGLHVSQGHLLRHCGSGGEARIALRRRFEFPEGQRSDPEESRARLERRRIARRPIEAGRGRGADAHFLHPGDTGRRSRLPEGVRIRAQAWARDIHDRAEGRVAGH